MLAETENILPLSGKPFKMILYLSALISQFAQMKNMD